MAHVAILIPGIMGSELQLNGKVIWPGSISELVLPYKNLGALMDPGLVATDVIRSVSISTQYQSLIDDLKQCGFTEHTAPGQKKTLFVCPYDWRKDNRNSAQTLAQVIDDAASLHGANTKVSIIAHSMGGLISRYYLESDNFNARPGFSCVRHLITLGTPHRGSPLALSAALGMEKRLFLNADQVKQLVSDPRYPSLYQLLPPPDDPFAWNAEQGRQYDQIDIYDTATAEALGLVSQNLLAARDFHSALDVTRRPVNNGEPVRYFFFVGTNQKTISAVTLLDKQTTPTSYRVRKMEQEDAGDGTVPSWSASLTGIQNQPVGGEHGTIYRSDTLRRTLGILLGKPGVLAATAVRIEMAVRDRVVNPSDEVNLSISFPSLNKLDGHLVLRSAKLDLSGQVTSYSEIWRDQIIYSGPNANKLNLNFPAPNHVGAYRVEFIQSGNTTPAASDELFVQDV